MNVYAMAEHEQNTKQERDREKKKKQTSEKNCQKSVLSKAHTFAGNICISKRKRVNIPKKADKYTAKREEKEIDTSWVRRAKIFAKQTTFGSIALV